MAAEVGTKKLVRAITKAHVRPIKKLGRKEIQLVTFDLPYLAFYYNQKLMLYRGGGEFEDIVGNLKEGLGVVLEEFYPLAGRLVQDQEGVFKVEYDDEMEGVDISEAAAEEMGIDDLMDDKSSNMLKELVPYTGILNVEGLHRPLLAVQCTKLRDGIVIGCAFNHAILDGTATWHFMNSWSEICRGATSISVAPFHDRLKARNTRVKLTLPSSPPPTNGDLKQGPPLVEKIFKFSESSIAKIKSKANANQSQSTGAKPFSTFQSLSAHLWRAVSRARGAKPEDITVYTVFADCRKRVDPPMPENYFGNLIQAIFTGTAVGLLLANPPEFGASVIQKAIEAHDSKVIENRNKEWESAPKIFEFKDAGPNCVAVGSSPRFRVYDVDFGWGKPVSVRSGSNNKFDGMVYLYQGKSGGGSIDVEITLEAKTMKNLEKDEEFLQG